MGSEGASCKHKSPVSAGLSLIWVLMRYTHLRAEDLIDIGNEKANEKKIVSLDEYRKAS